MKDRTDSIPVEHTGYSLFSDGVYVNPNPGDPVERKERAATISHKLSARAPLQETCPEATA